MKRLLTNIFNLTVICAFLSGCAGFLNVNPKGEVFDDDMFSSPEGYEDALYGIYNEISTNTNLYGGYFVYMPESLGQNVGNASDYQLGNLAIADWYTNGPVSIRKNVWSAAYKAINHINNIVVHSEEHRAQTMEHAGLYRGEALALRALLHFEIMRYYGVPKWASADEKKQTIPYVSNYSFDVTPYSSYDEVYAKILADLKEAESLLSEDQTLVTAKRDNVAGGFTTCRTTHLNLYAVQALIARVYWTYGDIENAAAYAEKVIESGKFSFRPVSSFVQPDNGTIDMHETIFGLYNASRQESIARQFSVGASTSKSFALASDWKSLYDDGSSTSRTDYRLTAWFNDGDQTLTKLVMNGYNNGTSTDYSGPSILAYNILRLPEMYYIMAEYYLDTDNAKAVKYYDAVVSTRGLDKLEDTQTSLTYDMLFKERRKEFYGEGFTWHEMKKLGMNVKCFAGIELDGTLTATYTFPLPDDETEGRDNIN